MFDRGNPNKEIKNMFFIIINPYYAREKYKTNTNTHSY
jgi:hypothetical protein